jgi:hypothetical protein
MQVRCYKQSDRVCICLRQNRGAVLSRDCRVFEFRLYPIDRRIRQLAWFEMLGLQGVLPLATGISTPLNNIVIVP